nr:hypothetical protein [Tanacetum cinerariifolium]
MQRSREEDNVNITNNVNVVGTNEVNAVSANTNNKLLFDLKMPALEDISTFNFSSDHEDDDEEANMNNMDTTIQVSPALTTRIHKDHPLDQVVGDLDSTTQTRNMSTNSEEHGFVTTIHQRTNHKDLQNCLFACFLSQEEPKKATVKVKTVDGEGQLQALVDGKKILITESTIRRDLQLEDAEGVDCLPNAVIFKQLTLLGAKITAWNEFSSTMVSVIICLATNQKFNFSKYIFESMVKNLDNVNKFLMYPRVLDFETTKTTQEMEIDSLKKRVKKLKRRKRSRTHGLKRLYKVGLSARVESSEDKGLGEEDASKQGRIADIDANEDITLVSTHDEQMFDADQDLGGEEAKAKRIVFHEPEESTTTTTTSIPKSKSQDKEANIALIESWDDVQVKINADYQLAKRLQAKEQQELNDEKKAKLFMQLLEKRRKLFAAKRAKEKRNKPPTQAHQRKIMCTYLKNMEGKKLIDLKNKSFDSIQKMFDRAFRKSSKKNEAKVTEGSSKRAGTELEQESAKKQKIDDDKDTAELQELVKIIPDEEGVAIDAIPLAIKPPSIVD